MKVLSIILDRDEMREMYSLFSQPRYRWDINTEKKNLYDRWMRDLEHTFSSSKSSEFVLVFKGVDIPILVQALEFKNNSHSYMGSAILKEINRLFGITGYNRLFGITGYNTFDDAYDLNYTLSSTPTTTTNYIPTW